MSLSSFYILYGQAYDIAGGIVFYKYISSFIWILFFLRISV